MEHDMLHPKKLALGSRKAANAIPGLLLLFIKWILIISLQSMIVYTVEHIHHITLAEINL